MEENKPLISVIILVYNIEDYLDDCLRSVINQSYKNIQIVVVNDGSKDSSGDIIARYAASDSRIEHINKDNEGISRARKDGLDAARGEYIFFLDGDDYIDLNTLDILYDAAVTQNCDVAAAVLVRVCPTYTSPMKPTAPPRVEGAGYLKALLKHQFFSSVAGKLYRKELWEGIKFYHDIILWEDFVFNMSLAIKEPSVCFPDAPLYFYVQRGSSLKRSKVTLSYLELINGTTQEILSERPDLREECRGEIVVDMLHWYVIYISKSSSEWIGNTEYARMVRSEMIANKKFISKDVPRITYIMVWLYRYRAFRFIVILIATFRRLKQSAQRRRG